ncbi:MAG: aspartate aminotransferase family protein [Candidatus Reddybacter sp.]
MNNEQAECGPITLRLHELGKSLDQYLRFDHPDAMSRYTQWHDALQQSLPEKGVGLAQVIAELGSQIIPNGSQIPKPGCTAFITTGATSAGVLASLAGSVAAPQRLGLTAFSYLEELSLEWMAEMFELPAEMKGLYSSGGSVANLVALGAARQWAFERIGIDPSRDGVQRPCRIYATATSHHTVHRAAAVLGMGRNAVVTIAVDNEGRMCADALRQQLQADVCDQQLIDAGCLPVAIVGNAGTTNAGVIDPLNELAELACEFSIWFHVDGAYGLPGILDPQVRPLYKGLEKADSVIVDPHKWLGAPVGIGATFVRDRSLLNRAFTQEASDYLEGSVTDDNIQHSMDGLGIPYYNFGVELSAPSRGAVVWALIREIGKAGMRERVCRHNAMARCVAELARAHPNLELVQEPTLSICCFRYVLDGGADVSDLNALNKKIHRQLVHQGRSIPSTAELNGVLAIRPCFVGARTSWEHAEQLVEDVIAAGNELTGRTISLAAE